MANDRKKYWQVCADILAMLRQFNKEYTGKTRPPLVESIGLSLLTNVTMLQQAWSSMAARNVMNDMVRDLVKLEGAAPAGLKKSVTDTKAKVNKVLQKHSLSKARYDQVVCLGYRVKTAWDTYKGKTDDWQDMKEKCEDMKRAIRAAYNLADATGNYNGKKEILKIFMAPEFFFRGINGAYDHRDVAGEKGRKGKGALARIENRKGLMEIMNEELDKSIYKDWLFVLGTAIAATRLTRTVCHICGGPVKFVVKPGQAKSTAVCEIVSDHQGPGTEESVGALIDNVALVKKEKEVYTVAKELVSTVDFVKDKQNDIKDVVTVRNEQLNVLRLQEKTKFQDERMGGSIFTIDGVTFGLEVCLDHKASVRAGDKGRLDHAANIQVQLIPSAGMQITQLRALPGGIIFNVDGTQPHVQVVAGLGSSQDIRFDIADTDKNAQWQLKYPQQVSWNDIESMARRMNEKALGQWDQPAAPKVTAGSSGSVLLYGPYDLPGA